MMTRVYPTLIYILFAEIDYYGSKNITLYRRDNLSTPRVRLYSVKLPNVNYKACGWGPSDVVVAITDGKLTSFP